jgi:hypothetical protein
MKTFRELKLIGGAKQDRVDFLKDMADNLPENWILKPDLVESYSKQTSKNTSEVICVQSPIVNMRSGLVWFGLSNDGCIYVYNIIPTDNSNLEYDEYNDILEEFYIKCIVNNETSKKFTIEFTKDEYDIKDFLSEKGFTLLERWEASCNHSTGNTHPLDFKRWAEFIIEVHKSKSTLSTGDLRRWLIEAKGWSEDIDLVYKMIIDYEYALSILEFYDKD